MNRGHASINPNQGQQMIQHIIKHDPHCLATVIDQTPSTIHIHSCHPSHPKWSLWFRQPRCLCSRVWLPSSKSNGRMRINTTSAAEPLGDATTGTRLVVCSLRCDPKLQSWHPLHINWKHFWWSTVMHQLDFSCVEHWWALSLVSTRVDQQWLHDEITRSPYILVMTGIDTPSNTISGILSQWFIVRMCAYHPIPNANAIGCRNDPTTYQCPLNMDLE